MFYFRALEHGLSELPSADQSIRKELVRELNKFGIAEMFRRLQQIDPELASRIDRNDSQRVQRALEIYHATGQIPSNLMVEAPAGLSDEIIKLAVFFSDRRQLHKRIALRFESMLEQGLVDEVSGLYALPSLSRMSPTMKIVGYRQVIEFLENEVSSSQLVENGVVATRQLAKRQLTWMRQQSGLVWFEAGQTDPLDTIKLYLERRLRDLGFDQC